MTTSYRRLLGHPGVPAMVTVSLFAKIGLPVLSLALVLDAFDRFGSYGTAGMVLTGHAIALAACAPAGGRLIDRVGTRRVLTRYLAAHAAGYAAILGALVARAPAAVLVAAAALLGATSPPTGAAVRSAWPRLVPGELLSSAYAVDNASNELMFIAGPVLVAALMLLIPAGAVVAVAGACVLAATAALLASPAVRREPSVHSEPPAHREPAAHPESAAHREPAGRQGTRRLGSVAGPLTHGPTALLLGIAALGTFSFGCLRIATVASTQAAGSPASAGVLAGLLSVGALIGNLGYGARAWPPAARTLIVAFCLLEAASMAAAAAVPHLPGILYLVLLGGLVTLTGLVTGPRDTISTALLAEHAPHRYRAEVFAWLNTFMWTGYGAGTALAGAVTRPGDDGAAAFAAAAVAAALAAPAVAALLRPARDRTVRSATRQQQPEPAGQSALMGTPE